MISRRNIRVKVMQTLYTIEAREHELKPGEEFRILQKHFDQSRQLFVYLIYFIAEIARYAETDSRLRSSKHLPSEQDRNVNIKLAGNTTLWEILQDTSFQKAIAIDKPQVSINTELVRKLYQELAGTEEYKNYIALEGRDKKTEKELLGFVFKDLMLTSESFGNHIEELFTNWDDDVDMMIQLLTAYLGKPHSFNFQEIMSKDKAEYARSLLAAVLEKKDTTMELIKPKLQNWDADRIATLDMILMQMGVCEFLYFETIPPKVTINEYIDLAKEYSTPQSGHFVNGILDNIHKELVQENKMQKVSFKPAKYGS